ncbi:hypothetical protein Tcan_00389, partial [Toxocara canis]
LQKEKFVQLEDGEAVVSVPAQPLFADCTPILKCCPCTDCSLRAFLKKICCNSESVRRGVNCECIRPAVHGSQSAEGVNFVCCQSGTITA